MHFYAEGSVTWKERASRPLAVIRFPPSLMPATESVMPAGPSRASVVSGSMLLAFPLISSRLGSRPAWCREFPQRAYANYKISGREPMAKISNFTAVKFRGISGAIEVTLTDMRSGKPISLLLYGDNGSGKSSLVDAVEFALRGRLSRRDLEGKKVRREVRNLPPLQSLSGKTGRWIVY